MSVTALAVKAVASRPTDRALAGYHDHAEAFHCAMARALRLADDIEDIKRDLRQYSFRSEYAGHDEDIAEMEASYSAAMGEAALALQKMPTKWAAILQCEVSHAIACAEDAATVRAAE